MGFCVCRPARLSAVGPNHFGTEPARTALDAQSAATRSSAGAKTCVPWRTGGPRAYSSAGSARKLVCCRVARLLVSERTEPSLELRFPRRLLATGDPGGVLTVWKHLRSGRQESRYIYFDVPGHFFLGGGCQFLRAFLVLLPKFLPKRTGRQPFRGIFLCGVYVCVRQLLQNCLYFVVGAFE